MSPICQCVICGGPHRSDGTQVRDPFYRGPIGHAPQNVCAECWCEHWVHVEAQMLNGGDWTNLDGVFWLIVHGVTRQAAAEFIGVHRNTIGRWIRKVKDNPELLPEWMTGTRSK